MRGNGCEVVAAIGQVWFVCFRVFAWKLEFMMKIFAGIGAFAVIVLVILLNRPDAPVAPTPIIEARVPLDVPRIAQGLPADRSLAEGQIWPWDNSKVQKWIDDEIARLDPLVTDEAYRQMTTDFSIRSVGDDGQERGRYYTSTYDAIGLLFDGDENESQAGLFVLLHMAKSGDPWAYYNIANWLFYAPDVDQSIATGLYREAADREFLPAIVNLVLEWETAIAVSRDANEAYLRYGFDMNASDGHWNITNAMINYYVYDNPSYSSAGYLDRAFETMLDTYGGGFRYHQHLGFRLDEGIDGPTDKAGSLREYLKSVELGGTWAFNRIGYKYMGGPERGANYDKDLARDYFLACLKIDPVDHCALNLGSLYNTPSRNSVDYAIAHAFYRHGVGMNGSTHALLLDQISNILPAMSDDQMRRANAYFSDISRGDFSNIPHVKDARPVTQ